MIFRLTLPENPPPLSACFKNARRHGRVKTKRYNDWIQLALLSLKQAPRIEGRIEVNYRFERVDRRKRDLGNLEKATSDILVTAGVIEDDSLIEKMTLAWGSSSGVEIKVREWLPDKDENSRWSQCEQCSIQFFVGKDTKHGLSTKRRRFCSDKCRVYAHRQEKKQAQAC